DGIATTVAVRDFGAIWRPVQRYGEEIPLEDIRRDVRDAFLGGRGLLHLPVHGEAGLAAVRGRPEWEGAHRLLQADLRPVDAYSTVGQGIGQQVREIENLMAVSKLGYGLLLGLLVGDAIDVDGPVGPYPPADLLAVGYGAGGTPGRADYPFERKIDEAGKRGHPSTGATWRALVYRGTSADVVRTAGWYAARGVEVIRYGDGELGTLVKTATP